MPYFGVCDKAGNVHDVPADHPADDLQVIDKAHIYAAAREIWDEPFIVYCLDEKYHASRVINDARYFVGRAHVTGKYIREIFDCDDFSRAFKEHMVEAGYTAVGRVVDFDGGHSYNAIVTAREPDAARIWLVEPQTGHIFDYPETRHKPYSGNGKGYVEF